MRVINSRLLLPMRLLCAGLFGCEEPEPSPDEVLARVVENINDHRSVQYEYRSYWDNRFNESTYRDSAQIIYSKLDGSFHGFGFFADGYDNIHLFDGSNYQEIRHEEETIIRYPSEEIAGDPEYFANSMFFFATPFEIQAVESFAQVIDTVLDHRRMFIYQRVEKNPSTVDSTKTVTRQRLYYVDPQAEYVTRVQNISFLDQDTTQIIDYHFREIRFDPLGYDFGDIERSAFAGYREVSKADLEREDELEQVDVGDRLLTPSYPDINDERVALYGTPGRETLIMFSFIGCGGCEYAMREMSKKNYQIREQLDFYYSSPMDPKTTLRNYLEKKKFPLGAFSKESRMNEDFSVYAFPTFVLLDSDGVVRQVTSGYNEEVAEMIFGE